MKMRKNETALTAKPLTIAERKARLAALVAAGKISAKAAKLIDFREPSPEALAIAKSLEGRARKFLTRNRRAVA